MFSKLKLYGLIILGTIAAYFGFRWKASEAKHAKEKLKGIKEARETERKATKAAMDGLEREEKAVEQAKEDARSGKRDFFE